MKYAHYLKNSVLSPPNLIISHTQNVNSNIFIRIDKFNYQNW